MPRQNNPRRQFASKSSDPHPARAAIRRAVQARLAHGLRPARRAELGLFYVRIGVENGPEQAKRIEGHGVGRL